MTVQRLFKQRLKRRLAAALLLSLVALVCGGPAAAQRQPPPTPLPLFALPDARTNRVSSSGSLALAQDGRLLAAANMLNNTISLIFPSQRKVAAEIPVGLDPRSVAFTPDDSRIIVANRGDSTLSVVNAREQTVTATIPLSGALPYAVVADNRSAYVAMMGSGEIAVVDLTLAVETDRIPVSPAPGGLALWGEFLYVTDFWNGQMSLIYAPQRRLIAALSTGLDTSLSQAIEIDPGRGIAYLPQTRSNADNLNLTFDTVVFPVINVVELSGLAMRRRSRINLDTAARPVNMPFAAALDRFRNRLYVANAGSDSLTVINVNSGLAEAHIRVGANPRGVLLNRDGSVVIVHNVLDGTLTFVQASDLRQTDTLPISNLTVSADILLGSLLFYNASDPRLSADQWVSCANCHFDGLSDGRVWRGFSDGPRNTPVLYGLIETAPYNASGTWDELADSEIKIRELQAGLGLITDRPLNPPLGDPHAGLSPDLDILASYLLTLAGPRTPPPADPDLVAQGAAVFAAQGCADCHVGTVGTDLRRYDVGTGGPDERQNAEFDTPSLRWLWLSAPYLHDGRAATLRELFLLPGAHDLAGKATLADIDALAAYLLTLPQP
jgi:YVTN family beta-propeller protein